MYSQIPQRDLLVGRNFAVIYFLYATQFTTQSEWFSDRWQSAGNETARLSAENVQSVMALNQTAPGTCL